jgi:hypothetical protein
MLSAGELAFSFARAGDGVRLTQLIAQHGNGVVNWRHPRNRQQTPLWTAAKYGRRVCVTVLLANGADIKLASDGLNAFHIAVMEGKTAVVSWDM